MKVRNIKTITDTDLSVQLNTEGDALAIVLTLETGTDEDGVQVAFLNADQVGELITELEELKKEMK